MEENSLTIAILKEIRDEVRSTRTDLSDRIDKLTGRVDRLTDRVDHLTDRVDVMGAVQIRQEATLNRIDATLQDHEALLVRLAEAAERHDEGIKTLIRVTDRIHDRIDHIYEGPVTSTLRDHESRIRRLEGRDD